MSAKNTQASGTPAPGTYEDRVGLMLDKLPMHQVFKLEGQVKKENRQQFVDTVKSYIDRNLGHNDGWEIIFNTDYSALKKITRHKPEQSQSTLRVPPHKSPVPVTVNGKDPGQSVPLKSPIVASTSKGPSIQEEIHNIMNISPEVLLPADPQPAPKEPAPATVTVPDAVVRVGFPILPKHRPSDPDAARYLVQFSFEDMYSMAQDFCYTPLTEEQFQNYMENKPIVKPKPENP